MREELPAGKCLASCGCVQEGGPQPVGFGPARASYSIFYGSGFLRGQSNRKHNCYAFCGETGAPHFGFHERDYFCLRKYLTRVCTFVYKCLASKFEARSCRKKCPHVPGETSKPGTPGWSRGGQLKD